MKMYRHFPLILLFTCLVTFAFAQQVESRVEGTVVDSAQQAIAGAKVLLVVGKDSLYNSTNKKGEFSFSKLKAGKAVLEVSMMGYKSYHTLLTLNQELHQVKVPLKESAIQIEEIVIKKKPNPIRVMQDTVEFDAEAFNVQEGDNVADLIKQFPGMEVDENYNVRTNDKPVVKLRVNGEDFFTSDVAEFIKKLPAGIVSKIQMIDDFGDQANFTGEKTGEPTQMINIVTKPGMNKGKFGYVTSDAATNNRISGNANINYFNESKQIGSSLQYSTENNGAGESQTIGGSFSIRNKFKEKGAYNIGISSSLNDAAYFRENYVETINDVGTYYNSSLSNGNSGNSSYNLNLGLNNQNKVWFYNGRATLRFTKQNNNSSSENNQTGVQKQGFRNVSSNTGNSPNIDFDLNLTRKFNNGKRNISGNISFNDSRNESLQSILSNTLYYNQTTGDLLKDSVLNRNLENNSHTQSFSFRTSYSFNLDKPSEDRTRNQFLSLNYLILMRNMTNSTSTNVYDSNTEEYHFVDSLSSDMRSLMIDQSLGMNYNLNRKGGRLTIGMNLRPVTLRNEYKDKNRHFNNNSLNYSPTLNYSRLFKKGKTLSINYSGNNNTPSDRQLQPVPNTQNLQNIIIGNPDLKSFFQHRISSNFNLVQEKSGNNLQLSANFSTTQNEVVTNMIIIPDTLGSYKRETHYVNGNGTYNAYTNYTINLPFKEKNINFSYTGNVGVSNRLLYVNSEAYYNKGLNFSQSVSLRYNKKEISASSRLSYSQVNNNNIAGLSEMSQGMGMPDPVFNIAQFTTSTFFTTRTFSSQFDGSYRKKNFNINARANYSLSKNENPKLLNSNRELHNIALSTNGEVTLFKTYFTNFSVSKRINKGYAIENQNPLLINLGVGKSFLKNNVMRLSANVNDLLNQGNMMSRQVSGNSIIDTRSNVVTRVFLLRLTYQLSGFGPRGMHFRVDPDPEYSIN
ncbi:TonB-dependent receptor [Sphingobacterium kyonggiense]|uniref:TonB-dependent receptor n=1 Tax=Sphingobacterium kyonggiense TaxID=714075 RepID=A0ABP7YSM3_9SPHI